MTLLELIERANAGYQRGFAGELDDDCLVNLTDFIDSTGRVKDSPESGDTLALFIVREIQDTYDRDASDEVQLETAGGACWTAIEDLWRVVASLSD